MAATNNMLLAVAFAFVCISIQSASSQITETCPFATESGRQAAINECTESDPDLREIIRILMGSQSQSQLPELMNRTCEKQDAVAKALACLVNKTKPCLPDIPGSNVKETLISLLPDESRLKRAFDTICENRVGITQADLQCFQPQQDAIADCIREKASSQIGDVDPNNPEAVKQALCSVAGITGSCIQQNKGTCSTAMVNTARGIVEIFNPCNGAGQIGATILLLAVAVFLSLFNNKMF